MLRMPLQEHLFPFLQQSESQNTQYMRHALFTITVNVLNIHVQNTQFLFLHALGNSHATFNTCTAECVIETAVLSSFICKINACGLFLIIRSICVCVRNTGIHWNVWTGYNVHYPGYRIPAFKLMCRAVRHGTHHSFFWNKWTLL